MTQNNVKRDFWGRFKGWLIFSLLLSSLIVLCQIFGKVISKQFGTESVGIVDAIMSINWLGRILTVLLVSFTIASLAALTNSKSPSI